jgi:hypothetical protein
VLRRIGSRSEEVTEEWRKLHNEELHNVFLTKWASDQIKKVEMERTCGTGVEKFIQNIDREFWGEHTAQTKADGYEDQH